MSPDLIRPSEIYNNGKGLQQIFDMCRRSFPANQNPANQNPANQNPANQNPANQNPANQIRAMFTQFALIGCVRAGLTRLDKRLVGVFDLK
jgi:hypothetical protein